MQGGYGFVEQFFAFHENRGLLSLDCCHFCRRRCKILGDWLARLIKRAISKQQMGDSKRKTDEHSFRTKSRC